MQVKLFAGSKGMSDLAAHFSDPKNHLDESTKHVSRDEFKSAAGKISPEADQIIEFIVYHDGYRLLKNLEKEGLFNDKEVSLRDMYAYARATDYQGKEFAGDPLKTAWTFHLGMHNSGAFMRIPENAPVLSCGEEHTFIGGKYDINYLTVIAPPGSEGKLAESVWIPDLSTDSSFYGSKGSIVGGTGRFNVMIKRGVFSEEAATNPAFKFVSEFSELTPAENSADPDACVITIKVQ